MQSIKNVVCLLIAMLALTLVGCRRASSSQPSSTLINPVIVTEHSASSFAKEEIRQILSDGPPQSGWNEQTDICSSVALYDFDDNCIGYIFKLSTNHKPTGYIQVNNINDELVVYCYSYDGKPVYEASTTGEMTAFVPSNDRLYFFGNFTYCTKHTNGKFSPLGSTQEYSVEDVATYYHDFLSQAKQRKEEAGASTEKP